MAKPAQPHVTMAQIARHAGVSQATVSLSLAQNPRIPVQTRERVCGLARKLGYRPNPLVSTLMSVRRKGGSSSNRPVLALVCCMESRAAWRNSPFPTLRQMYEGVMQRAAEHGFAPQEFWLHEQGMSAKRFSGMLHHRGVQGVVFGPLPQGLALPEFQYDLFSAVGLSPPLLMGTLTTVCNDHYLSSLRAVKECHQLGYRRPGLIALREHRDRMQGRWEAGCQIAPQFCPGLEIAPPLLLDDWSETLAAPLLAWLERERPDVILSPSAQVILDVLGREGWRVPRDIGVVHLACPELPHTISGIHQNGKLIGATAVDELVALTYANTRGLPSQGSARMVEGIWNPGATLRTVGSARAR